jgi:hypothetical protein
MTYYESAPTARLISWSTSLPTLCQKEPVTLHFRCFLFVYQFCVIAGLTILAGVVVSAQHCHVLLKTRQLLQYSSREAVCDVACVVVLSSMCNSFVGTAVLPMVCALLSNVNTVSVGVEAAYFALVAPLFSIGLVAIATVHPPKHSRPKNVARAVVTEPSPRNAFTTSALAL